MTKLSKSLTTVTPFTKLLALSMFVIFPVLGFWLGMKYHESKDVIINAVISTSDSVQYTNNLFSFDYPSQFSITLDDIDKNGGLIWMSNGSKDLILFVEKTNLSLEDYVDSNPLSQDYLPRRVTKTLENGIHIIGWVGLYRTNIIQYESFSRNGYVYNLGITARSNEDASYNLDSENGSLLDQILSTFKFTE